MLAHLCPFKIQCSKIDIETYLHCSKDQFVSFDIYLDPTDHDLGKSIIEVKKLDSTNAKDLFHFLKIFDKLVEELTLPEGSPRFRLMCCLLTSNCKRKWQVLESILIKNKTPLSKLETNYYHLRTTGNCNRYQGVAPNRMQASRHDCPPIPCPHLTD